MKKAKLKQPQVEPDAMRPEYDFTGKQGIRGRYYRAYQEGYTVTIHQADGTTEVQQFTPEQGAVILAPDVREYFPNSDAVNQALRCLIPLMPRKRKVQEQR